MIELTNRQARQFLLLRHGLLGRHRFAGPQGALAFVRQAGCIQYDPVDVCGRNAELTLQSRVKGFTRQTLYDLLYVGRSLVDYPDKNLSIFPTEDWPYFERYRRIARESGLRFPELAALEARTKAYIAEHGPVGSGDLPLKGGVYWHSAIHWSGGWEKDTNAARAALEQLYSTGELVVYRKEGSRKFYDLAARHIPAELLAAPDPLPDEADHRKWRVLRRIGAVGLMWKRPSDAWLNIQGLKTSERDQAFDGLLAEERIRGLKVEGFKDAFYHRSGDDELIQTVLRGGECSPRCELLAPLDCLLWDRRLIRALFGFDYTWEIYTPAPKRKYGYYVLPLLYGENFAGRVEAAADGKTGTLTVKNVWYEHGVTRTKKLEKAVEGCLTRFAAFNGCVRIERAGAPQAGADGAAFSPV
jgi:uncharacterized protein